MSAADERDPFGPLSPADRVPTGEPFWDDMIRRVNAIQGTSGERICKHCGKFFRRVKHGSGAAGSHGQGRTFCSQECYQAWRRASRSKKPPPKSDVEARAVWEAAEAELGKVTKHLDDFAAAERRLLDGP